MTVQTWLESRAPVPPPALSTRLHLVLGDWLHEPAARVPELCLAAGERLVAELLLRDDTSRASALDLLTADALVTYAFEGAGELGADVDAHAASVMRRISALASVP